MIRRILGGFEWFDDMVLSRQELCDLREGVNREDLARGAVWLGSNAEKSEGPLLGAWAYGSHMGAPAVLFGMDYDNYSYVEIPLKSVKKVTFSGYEIVQCKGNPEHRFIAPLPAWKYCPFDGKPLVRGK